MAPRVYSAMEARQQGAQTLVSTWDDVRRNMTLCLAEGRPCNLLMTADLFATSTLTVPTGLPSFSLDGGGKYILNVKGSYTRWCAVNSRTHLHDVAIRLLDGSNLAQMFGVGETASLTLARCSVDASKGGIADVFGLLDTYATGLVVDSCRFNEVRNIFADDGAFPRRWDRCSIRDCSFDVDIDFASATTLGRGPSSIAFRQCEFARIGTALAVDLGVNSHQCVFSSLPAFFGLTTNSSGVLGHTFIACSIGGTPVLGGADVWFGDAQIIAPGSTLSVDDLAVVNDVTVGGDLDVTGYTTMAGAQVTGNLTVTNTAFANLVRLGNGSAANPSYGFALSNGNGAYIAAANDWRLAAGGTDTIRLTSTATAITSTMSVSGATSFASTVSVTGGATFNGPTQFNDDALFAGWYGGQVQGITITGANQTITPTKNNVSVTFTSATGVLKIATAGMTPGWRLTVRCNTVTATTATLTNLAANGVVLLAALGTWTPKLNNTIEFWFNGSLWVELQRGDK